jgi:hypothetical protein
MLDIVESRGVRVRGCKLIGHGWVENSQAAKILAFRHESCVISTPGSPQTYFLSPQTNHISQLSCIRDQIGSEDGEVHNEAKF